MNTFYSANLIENKIEIEVDYIELDDVITEVRGGRLHIHLERGSVLW